MNLFCKRTTWFICSATVFPDQFGGPRGKKLKEKTLKGISCTDCFLSMEDKKKSFMGTLANGRVI